MGHKLNRCTGGSVHRKPPLPSNPRAGTCGLGRKSFQEKDLVELKVLQANPRSGCRVSLAVGSRVVSSATESTSSYLIVAGESRISLRRITYLDA